MSASKILRNSLFHGLAPYHTGFTSITNFTNVVFRLGYFFHGSKLLYYSGNDVSPTFFFAQLGSTAESFIRRPIPADFWVQNSLDQTKFGSYNEVSGIEDIVFTIQGDQLYVPVRYLVMVGDHAPTSKFRTPLAIWELPSTINLAGGAGTVTFVGGSPGAIRFAAQASSTTSDYATYLGLSAQSVELTVLDDEGDLVLLDSTGTIIPNTTITNVTSTTPVVETSTVGHGSGILSNVTSGTATIGPMPETMADVTAHFIALRRADGSSRFIMGRQSITPITLKAKRTYSIDYSITVNYSTRNMPTGPYGDIYVNSAYRGANRAASNFGDNGLSTEKGRIRESRGGSRPYPIVMSTGSTNAAGLLDIFGNAWFAATNTANAAKFGGSMPGGTDSKVYYVDERKCNFKFLAMGIASNLTFGIDANDDLWVTGNDSTPNSSGLGSAITQTEWNQVNTGIKYKYIQTSNSFLSTASTTVALTTSGEIRAWGNNQFVGGHPNSATPVILTNGLPTQTGNLAVASCADALLCVASNSKIYVRGQDSTVSSGSLSNVYTSWTLANAAINAYNFTDVALSSDATFSGSYMAACAIAGNQTVSWGNNTAYELGDGTNVSRTGSNPFVRTFSYTLRKVYGGFPQKFLLIAEDATTFVTYRWGYDGASAPDGELGLGFGTSPTYAGRSVSIPHGWIHSKRNGNGWGLNFAGTIDPAKLATFDRFGVIDTGTHTVAPDDANNQNEYV